MLQISLLRDRGGGCVVSEVNTFSRSWVR